ncbi:hypothetical protein ACFL2F_00670 [Myxococcota bacterium]
MHRIIAFILAGALLCSCGGRRDVYDGDLVTIGPFPINGALCFINRSLADLVCLRVTPDSVLTDRAYLRPGPRKIIEVSQKSQLAVLHDDEQQPGVALLGATGLREMGWIPLGEQFDQLALAPSTRYAIAHFSPTAGQSSGGIRNLNQVQVVDFQSGTSHLPLALQTGGLSPLGVDFLPEGSGRFDNVAVIRVDNGLVILDMEDPGAEPLWVRFTNTPGGLAQPAEVVFGPFFGDGGYIFVRLEGGSDVLSIRLTRAESGKLRRSINFLNVPASSHPSDLLVLRGAGFEDKVFVVYGTSNGGAAILDANAIQTDEMAFDFEIPVNAARRLLGPDGIKEFVAVYHTNTTSGKIYVVDPESGDTETVHLQDSFNQVAGPLDSSFLVAFHPKLGQTSTPGLRVVRMITLESSGRYSHRIATYSVDKVLQGYTFGTDGISMLGALSTSEITFVLDLETGEYESMRLDKAPVGVGLVPASNWAFFQHANPLGSLTFVPTDRFDRDHAVMLEGFVLEGLLSPR